MRLIIDEVYLWNLLVGVIVVLLKLGFFLILSLFYRLLFFLFPSFRIENVTMDVIP